MQFYMHVNINYNFLMNILHMGILTNYFPCQKLGSKFSFQKNSIFYSTWWYFKISKNFQFLKSLCCIKHVQTHEKNIQRIILINFPNFVFWDLKYKKKCQQKRSNTEISTQDENKIFTIPFLPRKWKLPNFWKIFIASSMPIDKQLKVNDLRRRSRDGPWHMSQLETLFFFIWTQGDTLSRWIFDAKCPYQVLSSVENLSLSIWNEIKRLNIDKQLKVNDLCKKSQRRKLTGRWT